MPRVKKRRSFPFIQQRDMTECGTTCLAMIFRSYGLYNIQSSLRSLGRVSTEGTDLFTLSEIAETFGFTSDGYQLDIDTLDQVPLPCIAHYEGNHYVVIHKVTDKEVFIADPAFGKDRLSKADFAAKWNGIVLTLEPTEHVFQHPDVADLVEAQRSKEQSVRQRFYTALLQPFKQVLFEILVASFVLQLLALALPFFTQVIIDQALVYQSQTLLYAVLAGMVVILLTQVMLTYVRNLLLTQFKVRFELDFFSSFFGHFIRLRQRYFDSYKREDFINRFQENLKIRNALSPAILQAFIDLLFVVNAVVVFFLYDALLALIATGFIVFFILMVVLFSPRLRRLENKIFHENLRTMGAFLDTLLGMQTVKLLGLERLKLHEWKAQYKRALNKVLATEQTHIVLQSTLKTAYFISQICVYWIGAYLTFQGNLTIGQYVAFVAIFTIAMTALDNVSSLWFMMTELSVTYDRLNDVFMQEPEPADLLQQRTYLSGRDIHLQDVAFAYTEAPDRRILDGLTLQIPEGQHVALVGRNGSGKTTLVKLLVGLYDHYDGTIKIGETELRQYHPQYLRRQVFMVPQRVHLFHGTLKDNILYGNPDATMEEVVEAARLADLHDYVQSLYLGYNTIVGEAGSNLSGGQQLKVAFARLFLSKADIVILDEASSALDVEAEQRILHNLRSRFDGKTIISIAHRMGTVRRADRILVLEGGQIVEDGSHDQLMAAEGAYHRIMTTYLDM